MTYEDSIFVRSFSQHELKKLGCIAVLVFFIMAFTICTILKLPFLNLEESVALGLKMLMSSGKMDMSPQIYPEIETVKTIHNFSNSRSDVFEINGDIRIQNNTSTIFITSSLQVENISSWNIRPYARKQGKTKIRGVRNWKVKYQVTRHLPYCGRRINIPAILFSTGSNCENYFHAFTDVLIPLYLTSRQFNGTTIFLITNNRPWWSEKYKTILGKLSKYEILDIDKEKEVLCFSRMIVGLKSNKEFGLDPLVSPYYSINDFRQFLRSTYSLKGKYIYDFHKNCSARRPRMLLISRKKTRCLKNEGDVANMARMLGFDVVVKELGSNVSSVAQFVNSFDVMMGVHGAGLTNMVFLPDNAVVIQIIPFALDFPSDVFFEFPAKDMKLRYLEYKVSLNESSLLRKYPPDSEVLRDPHTILMKGGIHSYKIYFSNQEVNLDLARFKTTLLNALEIVFS